MKLSLACLVLLLSGSLTMAQEDLREDLLIEQEVEFFDSGLKAEEIAENEKERQRLAIEQQAIEQDIEVIKGKTEEIKDELQVSRRSLAEAKQANHEENLKLTETRKNHDAFAQANQQVIGELKAAEDVLAEQKRQIEQLKGAIMQKKRERKALLQRKANAQKVFKEQSRFFQKLQKYDQQITGANDTLEEQVIRLEREKAKRSEVHLSSI